ncbi:MAG: hypothetical protein F6K40_00885 [Okeania sp. SIO3I5]|uniref:hypothetical protein n=1 Tax=Okeania sp. SIO3I5 TaxID=2607805 RepID=UPI0013B78B44|nr:hypothetical protein [Okeania sp. SIO3I5]NEQ34940.1 hypothetical protein [Okeania sp. SIO3I5]
MSNEDLYAYTLSVGGKRYPCDSLVFPKTNEEWKEHFDEKWDFVDEGKNNYDPKHILKSLLTVHNNIC